MRVGALVTMNELAADPTVSERVPFVRDALLAGASPQLRNMATIGGNLLQRTRCRYFRDPTVPACNKRTPGSGCAALRGPARMHAILGASEHCIAVHASDLCLPLVALDTLIDIQGADGSRSVALTQFHVVPGARPDIENVLEHGELITRIRRPTVSNRSPCHRQRAGPRIVPWEPGALKAGETSGASDDDRARRRGVDSYGTRTFDPLEGRGGMRS